MAKREPSKPEAVAPKKPAAKPRAKKPAAKKPKGRPSTFTQSKADEICARLSEGEPLRQICRDDNMPAWRTVYGWISADEAFAARIARGRELGEDAIAQDCLRIADDGRSDTYIDADGKERVDSEHIQRSKLRIETRLKLLAKWNPRKYGDKVDLNHGGQADNPLTVLMQQLAGKTFKPVE